MQRLQSARRIYQFSRILSDKLFIVAEIVEVPPMRVYEVATFYTMYNREPVGKHVIQVCTTTPCELCGSTAILEALKSQLQIKTGETSSDGMFTLTEVECQGACVNAPLAVIDDQYYEDLTSDIVLDIVEKLKQGKPLKCGTQQARKNSQPGHMRTTLKGEAKGPGFGFRKEF